VSSDDLMARGSSNDRVGRDNSSRSTGGENGQDKRANDEFHGFVTPKILKIPVDFVQQFRV
jgi:hypothetical protein